jgi:hypothetical protein
MPILFRDQYTGKINNFDIPLAHKPPDAQPGDFMLMRVITLSEREQAPKVSGWTLLTYDYAKGVSQFLYTKICDDNGDTYPVVRRKVGTNYISVYSWYSTDNKEILIDYESLVMPTNFKQKNGHKFNIDDYKLKYESYENKCEIKLYNGKVFITFNIYENKQRYVARVARPILKEVTLISNSSAILKWDGDKKYNIESSTDGKEWNRVTENSLNNGEYQVNDLLPNAQYYFRICLDDNSVLCEPSKPIIISTSNNIVLRSTSKNSSSTMNPRIITSPPHVQKGDLMIMQISYMDKMDIIKISHGWKLLKELKTDEMGMSIYYKFATRKEPASYVVQHNGLKHKKMLMAIAAFYSINGKPIRIHDSDIQYNLSSNYIHYPEVNSDGIYSLEIALSLRNIESSLKFPMNHTIMWDTDKNLRTTGIFQGHNNEDRIVPQSIYCNIGTSIAATISLIEGEIVDAVPPMTPTGFKAKQAEGTIIRLNQGIR